MLLVSSLCKKRRFIMKIKNNLKRILSGVMSFAVTASTIPCFPAFADEQTESDWTFSRN